MSSFVNISRLRDLYHNILEEEARRICNVSPNQVVHGKLCSLSRTQYYLTYDDLLKIASITGLRDSEAKMLIDELISRGFLIPLNQNCFRSYHFDFLLRISDLRTAPWTKKMTTEVKFVIGVQEYEDPKQASLLPRPHGEEVEEEFYKLLISELGDLTSLYVKIVSDYLWLRGSNGFTYFQMRALIEAIKNFKNSKTIAIGAPAGFGKTEIFLGILLFKILKDLKQGRRSRILIIYPRKFLEIDQAYRIIEFVRIVNENLRTFGYRYGIKRNEYSVTIRDGDSYKIEEQVNNCRISSTCNNYVPFRGIRCCVSARGRSCIEGTLQVRVSDGKIVCRKDALESNYDFVKWSREDAKQTEIIITNLYTFFNRIIAVADRDLDARDLILSDLPLEMIVLDEAHEYEPVELGLLHYIIKLIDRKKESEEPLRLVISTATLANMKKFAQELRGASDNEVVMITYDDIIDRGMKGGEIEELRVRGKIIATKKFIILGIVFVHPMYSWETYTAYLTIYNLFTNFVLGLASGSKAVKQAIIFLNNVKELNRIYTIIENELNLGTPVDFTSFSSNITTYSNLDPIANRYSLKHYSDLLITVAKSNGNVTSVINNIMQKKQMKEELFPRLAKVFADIDLNTRRETASKIQSKEIYTVIATSSLELGVDYPGVTLVANIGLDKVPSLIQRFGRAGRKPEETLNTILALLVVRNNPIEYVRVFRLLKELNIEAIVTGRLRDIVDEEIIEELTVNIGKDLIGVKKLATSRILFAINALDQSLQHLHGLAPINATKLQEECSKLVELRNALQLHRSEVEDIVGKDAVEAFVQEILKYDNVSQCVDEMQKEIRIEEIIDSFIESIKNFGDLCNDVQILSNKGVVNATSVISRCNELYNKYKERIKAFKVELFVTKRMQEIKALLQEVYNNISGYYKLLSDTIKQLPVIDEDAIELLKKCNKLKKDSENLLNQVNNM
jgi:urease gamma subunit